jgi:ERCC4-type nuclease
MLQLIIDTRERALHKYLTHYSFAVVQQITHGDFNILINGRLMATIERKTINDYAASITDGRTANKNKLLSLRSKTGCQIYYIVEGNLNQRNPETLFHHVKWSSIQNSMMHLRTEHYIFIERTASAQDSAIFLIELCSSFMRREGFSLDLGLSIANTYTEPTDFELPNSEVAQLPETTYELERTTIGNDEELLTLRVEKSRKEQIIAIWCNITGIGLQTAIELSTQPIITILCADLNTFTISGKKLNKRTRESLHLLHSETTNDTQKRFISGFPNIGMKRAVQLMLYFGCLANMVNNLAASDIAISKVDGFGNIVSRSIHSLIFTY